jgi:toxin CcdB
MARYDVYASPNGASFLLDVQADLLDDLNTRVVVPLMSVNAAPAPARQLNPMFDIRSERCVMATQFLSAVPVSILKTPVVSLAKYDREIDGALDMLLAGCDRW